MGAMAAVASDAFFRNERRVSGIFLSAMDVILRWSATHWNCLDYTCKQHDLKGRLLNFAASDDNVERPIFYAIMERLFHVCGYFPGSMFDCQSR